MASRSNLLRTLLIIAALVSAGLPAWAQQLDIIVISRERLLREVNAAQTLASAEQTYTAELQKQIDTFREVLSQEEAEIARLRAELATDDLNQRIADFDRRLRQGRRISQERAAELQAGFQRSRARIVASLPRILEILRQETGAQFVLNAEQVLAADPALDMTARAIELYNAEGPPAELPAIDLTLPIPDELGPDGGETGTPEQ